MMVNAVFEGGGVRGIALAGAVDAAERKGVGFKRLAGTSSGSIVAALLAAGYNAAELKAVIEATPFRMFLKRGRLFNVAVIGPAVRLLMKKGLYSGEALEYWMRKLLLAKGVRTFGDLPKGKLTIIASDISNGRIVVLPDDMRGYGFDPARLEIAKAVRMSASIPYFFEPVLIRQPRQADRDRDRDRCGDKREKSRKARYAYIVDGGLLSNFPLWLFDEDESKTPTIGFQLVGRHDNEPRHIRGPLSMMQAMFETMMQAHDERYIEKHNRNRTVKIPTLGVRATQFDLTPDMSEKLFRSGRDKTETFFREFHCP